MPFRVRDLDLPKYLNDSEHWREVYEGLIVPAIKDAGLQAERDDDDYTTRLVGEGIWSKIEQADLVLCDMSSHNPNVHLELGWAMRSDKKLVLIKDEVTTFNFDLNQYYTFEYSSRLQPSALRVSIKELSKVIKSTLNDDVLNYSMVSKLALRKRVVEAASEGSLEVRMLQEILVEIRSIRTQGLKSGFTMDRPPNVFLKITHPSELKEKLIGTTWRKKEGLEEILFTSTDTFAYTSVGTQKWLVNDFSFDAKTGIMNLTWRHDNFQSTCRFDSVYSQFTEHNGEVWYLIAVEPFIHPSFISD